MDHVAERAGVTKATVYYHFADKESLYAAVAANAADEHTNMINLLTTDNAKSPAQKLADLICWFIDSVLDRRTKRIHYDQRIQFSDETKRILRNAQHCYADAISDEIREAQKAGHVYPGDAKLMALAVFEGAGRIAIWYDPDGRVASEQAHAALCGMFLRGLLTSSGIASVKQFAELAPRSEVQDPSDGAHQGSSERGHSSARSSMRRLSSI
jgi:AcrR family transcriptional regulator